MSRRVKRITDKEAWIKNEQEKTLKALKGRNPPPKDPKHVRPQELWEATYEQLLEDLKNRGPGPARKYEDPNDLLVKITEYFQWSVDNPLYVTTTGFYMGQATDHQSERPRPFTMGAMFTFIGISKMGYQDWKTNRPDLWPVMQWAEETIHNQKFGHAAIGVYNATLIARDLGLADRTELTGADGAPVQTISVTRTVVDPKGDA